MRLSLLRIALAAAGTVLLALNGVSALPISPPPTASPAAANEIVVNRAAGEQPGAVWDITLPHDTAGTLTDQEWLVVDGQSEGMGGGYLTPEDAAKPLRLYANVSDEMDGLIKDTLKAQGFPVKPGVTVYHISYGVNRPVSGSSSRTLRLRHYATRFLFTPIPAEKRYKVGDRIPLYDVVAVDASVPGNKMFDPKDPTFRTYAHLPNDLAHRITVQIQFLPTPPTRVEAVP